VAWLCGGNEWAVSKLFVVEAVMWGWVIACSGCGVKLFVVIGLEVGG